MSGMVLAAGIGMMIVGFVGMALVIKSSFREDSTGGDYGGYIREQLLDHYRMENEVRAEPQSAQRKRKTGGKDGKEKE